MTAHGLTNGHGQDAGTFTFVISARNEEQSVATIVGEALAAARDGDRVLVVDSASTDRTAEQAALAGAEVLPGPEGKGAAINVALAMVRTEWVCFLDADLTSSEINVPARLREVAVSSSADHVIGDFELSDPGAVLSCTFTIYEPLTAEFFPEVGFCGANSLTGFRALRTSSIHTPVPMDFGVESFLNISTAVAGGTASICHLGVIESRFKFKGSGMASEIGRTVLDTAVSYGRLSPADRPSWDRWVEEGAAVIATITADDARSAVLSRLFAAVRRPMPSMRIGLDTDRGSADEVA